MNFVILTMSAAIVNKNNLLKQVVMSIIKHAVDGAK